MDPKTGIHEQTVIICDISSCEARATVRGWCEKHYVRWLRHGDPLKTKYNKGPVTWEYLLSCCTINKETGCVEWQKARSNDYGKVTINYRQERAHRISYEINIGPIPDGMFVLHHCDNPPCINPDHLFLGTQADNCADMANKDRSTRGERNPQAKLTGEDVTSIREMNGSNIQIAKNFGVCQATISNIKARRSWKHMA